MKLGASGQSQPAWMYILVILATIVVTYVPVVAFDYAYADDYWVLSMRPLNHEVLSYNILNNNTEGRPLLSIWQLGIFGLCGGIQGLKYVRLLAVIGIFFSSLAFYKLLRSHLIEDSVDAMLVASIFAINPTFLIVGGWAENGFISYGCLLGLLSSYVLLQDPRFAAKGGAFSLTGLPWGRLVTSALLIAAAALLYQPTAMLYWTGIAIWIIGRFRATRDDWMKLVGITVFFFGVIGAYFLFCHALWPPSNRFHLSFNVIRRTGWFVVYPLNSTLSFPFIEPSKIWSMASLFILSFGIWTYCRQTSRTLWIPTLILAMLPLTVLPTIVAYVHYDVSRTRGSIYGVIIVLWYVTLEALVRRYGKGNLKLRYLLIPALVLLMDSGQYHLQRYFVMPQLWDESALLVQLQQYVRENPNLDRAIALRPPPNDITEFRGVDEMGFAGLSRGSAADYEVNYILAGVAHRPVEDLSNFKIVTVPADGTPPQDAFVLDFRELRSPQ